MAPLLALRFEDATLPETAAYSGNPLRWHGALKPGGVEFGGSVRIVGDRRTDVLVRERVHPRPVRMRVLLRLQFLS